MILRRPQQNTHEFRARACAIAIPPAGPHASAIPSSDRRHYIESMRESQPSIRVQALIIGAGFAGIGMARQLQQLGIENFVLIERASGPGGVWEANRYPGAACDVPSNLYSFSFAPATHWSRRYGLQPEIRTYLVDQLHRLQLGDRVHFDTEIVSACWDANDGSWRVQSVDGRMWQARMLISAVGQLSNPALPTIDGLDTFAGPCVHSAQWPDDLDLHGKRVAVIGSGASAIQFVPAILPQVQSLTLFQRSPPYVLPKPDQPYSDAKRARYRRWPWLLRLSRLGQYLSHEARGMVLLHSPLLLRGYQCYFNRTLRREIADPQLRAKLQPGERLGCKRVLFSNDWYAALADAKTEVIGSRIRAIEEHAVVTDDGVQHPADVLILGTGFQATRFLTPMQITGKDGLDLNQAWDKGAEAYYGMCMPGFPNFFMLYGPNTNLGHNSIVYMLESQLRYLRGALCLLRDHPQRSVEVRNEVQTEYQQRLEQRLRRSVWASGCSSWYHDEHGRITTNWPGSTLSYAWQTRRFLPHHYKHVDHGPHS